MSFYRLVIIPLAVVAVFFGCKGQANTSDQSEITTTAKAASVVAPPFQLTDLKGETFSLSDFKGKVVFLDFWATWCPPCLMSIPEVEKLKEDYANQPVEVISISLDTNEQSVRKFVESRNMTNRVALSKDSNIEENYRINGIPAFFLIDKQGRVTKVWEGYHPSMSAYWRKELESVLKN